MTVIGSASVDIRANDKFFERDVRRIAKGIKDVTLNIKADVDLTRVNKKLRDFRSRNEKRVLTLQADLNTSKLDKKMEKLWNSYDGQTIDVGFTQTGLDKIESQLKELKALSKERVTIDVDINEDAIQDSLDAVDATVNVTAETADATSQMEEVARSRHAQIDADADTAIAEAQLAFAARNRSSTIRASIDPETMAGIKGFFYTLTGALPADKVKSVLVGMSANFEALSVKAGVASTGVLGLAASLLHLTGDALTIGADLTQVVGLLAAIPAAAGMGAVAITSLMLGWKGFGKAMGTGKEAEEALKTLPKQAQEAIKGIKGVGGTMRQVAQQAYWKELGTSLQDTVRIIKGPLTKGLQGSSKAMGQQTKALFESFQRFSKSGGLADTFNNINESISRSAKAVSGFSDGFLALMQGGSKSLPKFGTWMGDLGTKFSKWAKQANDSGQITVWIDTATQRIKELGSIIKSTTGIFSGLTNAARNAGMNGLPELAGGLEKVSGIVNSPKFQAGMTDIFLSARKSIENMGPGIRTFFDMVAKGTPKIGQGMEIAGETVGQTFKNVSGMFKSGDLGDGLLDLLSGMRDAMKLLEPGFESLGGALGGLARIAGQVVTSMAPGLNQLFDTLDGVINGMADGIIEAMPIFNEFMQGLFAALKAVVVPLASALGGLLSAFSALPGPIRTVIMALAAMLLLRRQFGGFFAGIRDGLRQVANGTSTTLANSVRGTGTAVARAAQTANRVNGSLFNAGRVASRENLRQDARNRQLLAANALSSARGSAKAEIAAAKQAQKEKIAQTRAASKEMIKEAKAQAKLPQVLAREAIRDQRNLAKTQADLNKAKAKLQANSSPTNRLGRDAAYAQNLAASNRAMLSQLAVQRAAENKANAQSIRSARETAVTRLNTAISSAREETAAVRREQQQRVKEARNYNRSVQANPTDTRRATTPASLSASATRAMQNITPRVDTRALSASLSNAERAVQSSTARMSQAVSSGMGRVNVGNTLSQGIARSMQTAERAVQTSTTRMVSDATRAGQSTGRGLSTGISSATRSLNLSPMQARIVGAFAGIRQAATTTATTMRTTAMTAKTAWSGVGTAIASGNVRSSLGSVATAAGKSAKALGGGAGKGLAGAAAGLLGAFGGPWGLVIAGGIAGIAAIGSASAESKEKIKTLRDTMSSKGEATSETKKVNMEEIQNDDGDWLDKARSVLNGNGFDGADISKQFEAAGESIPEFTTNLMSNVKAQETWQKISDKAHEFGNNANGTQIAEDLGLSAEQLESLGFNIKKLDANGIKNMAQAATALTQKNKDASKSAQELSESYEKTAKGVATSNKAILGDIKSSAGDKLGAFKANQQIFGLEQLSGQSGLYDLGIATDQTNSQVSKLKDALAGTGKTLKDTFDVKDIGNQSVAMFKMNTAAGRGMFDVMRTQADGIKKATIDTYDTVLKQTGDVGQAQAAAMKTSSDEVSKFSDTLRKSGLDQTSIDKLIDTSGLKSSDIEIALKTSGTDEAINDAIRIEAALTAMRSGDYTAAIDVTSTAAKAKISEVTGLAEGFSAEQFEAKVSAKFENKAQYDTWMAEFSKSTDTRRYNMIVELMGADAAVKSINTILKGGGKLNATDFKAKISTVAETKGMSIGELTSRIQAIPKDKVVQIRSEAKNPEAAMDQIIALALRTNPKVPVSTETKGDPLSAINAAIAAADAVIPVTFKTNNINKEQDILGKNVTSTIDYKVQGFDHVKATNDVLKGMAGSTNSNLNVNVTGQEALNNAKTNMDSATNKNVSLDLQVTGLVQMAVLQASIAVLQNKTINVDIKSSGNLDDIRASMNSVKDKSVKVSVNADSGKIGAVKSSMDSVKNKSVKVTVNANSKSISSVRSAMDSVKNKSVKVTVTANAGGIRTVQTALSGIKNKAVKVTVNASTATVRGLQGAINGIKAKTVTIKANVSAAMGAISKVNGAKINAKTLTINGNAGPALSAIGRVNSAHVANKTQTITTIHRTVNKTENADGAMYFGGVKSFAKGGMDPRAIKALSSFKGGSENHRAQIAKGATKFRIWGEPETDGEAYIPLGKSKRSRSLKILEQVAQHFGMSLSQQFSEGGFLSGMSLGTGVTSYASGGTSKKTDANERKNKEKKKEAEKKAKDLNNELKKAISELRGSISEMGKSIKTVFGKGAESPLQSALSGMSKDLKSFAGTYKKSKPTEAKRALASVKVLDRQYKASKVWERKYTKNVRQSNGRIRKQTVKRTSAETSRRIGQDAIRGLRKRGNARIGALDNFSLRDYELALANVTTQLEKAQSRLDNIKSAQKSMTTGTAGSLFGSFDLNSLKGSQDIFGNDIPVTAKSIGEYAQKRRNDMSKLQSNINRMRAMKYNQAFIADIANMSLDDALDYSNALIKTNISGQFNKNYTAMFGKSGQYNLDGEGNTYVGGIAQSIGTTLSGSLFNVGKNAAQGLVNGLTSEKNAIQVAGQLLSDQLIKSIKKVLKIKSPSRVTTELGSFTGQGLANGILSQKNNVVRSMKTLTDFSQVDLSVPTRSNMEFQNSQQSGILNRTGSSAKIELNQTINPSEGMSEEQIGKSAANNILFRLGTLA